MPRYAQVILAFAKVPEIDRPFTYLVPKPLEEKVQIGMRVKVQFGAGKGLQMGYIIGLLDEIPPTTFKLKAIQSLIDHEPFLDQEQMSMVQFIVDYYGTSYAGAFEAVTPPGLKDEVLDFSDEVQTVYTLNENMPAFKAYEAAHRHKKSFEKQQMWIDYFKSKGEILKEELIKEKAYSPSSLKTLIQKGFIRKEQRRLIFKEEPIHKTAFKVLNDDQQAAVDYMKALEEAQTYRTVLLQGVTGSGKTEVFLYVIRHILEKGKTAIVLVPEIALTPQTLHRFEERFGNRVALTHSRMTQKERQKIYIQAKKGEVSVVIGPRSAVFMPLSNLGLIVVDEAHESTYKSDTTPRYHAVDIAKERMKKVAGQVLLATATPSMEDYYKAREGQYSWLHLKKRIGQACLPAVHIVDMRQELQYGNMGVLSHALSEAIEKTVEKGEQVMLLINRRGHSTFVNCRNCGYVIKCEHCDVSMTYHKANQKLICHYCGKEKPIPTLCPSCGSKHIRFFGSGTEKVEAQLEAYFGNYGILRMDLDTTTGKQGHQKILEAFRNKEGLILIGTQMIAKGHDFPNVTLVGIISADQSLNRQDFRSNEHTFQLLTQTMGRAGRGDKKGQVIIQTYSPEHFVIQMLKKNAQTEFYEEELKSRERMGYPPYGHIFTVLVTGKDEVMALRIMNHLASYFEYYSEKGKTPFRLIGPTAAAIGKIGDAYRFRLIILSKEREKLLIYGRYCLEKFYEHEKPLGVKITWDVDPLNMF